MVHLDSNDNIIYMVVEDKLTNHDFDKIAPFVHHMIVEHDKIRLYYEMNRYKGWTFQAFWRDLYMDLKYRNNVEKIAMVGEKSWEKWLAEAIRPFSAAEVRFYYHLRKKEAKEWITE